MKKYRLIILHLTCWLALPFVLTFFKWLFQLTSFPLGNKARITPYFQIWSDNIELNLTMVLIGASSFYITYLLVFPAFTQPVKKHVKITAYVFLLLISPFLILNLVSIFSLDVSLFFRYFLFCGYIGQVLFILAAITAGYLSKWLHSKQAFILMEKQAVRAELELLKSQTNPHFLFNTINNIDTLIIKDPQLASRYLNGLAQLLRFMLYEARMENVSLSKELSYIKKYIELQQIRSVNPNFIRLTINGRIENQQIAPLLFIPMVENAFKHVTDKLMDDSIRINFEVTSAWVLFNCTNRFEKSEPEVPNEDGLGLGIISQRLALIYPGRHELNIDKTGGQYTVSLKLFFSDAN